MKTTILYIAEDEKDVQSFLKYLNKKLISESRMSKFDLRHYCIETNNYVIIGKSLRSRMLGVGYGHVQYYTVSSNLTQNNVYYKNKLPENLKCCLDTILIHTREDTEEISELEMLYELGLV